MIDFDRHKARLTRANILAGIAFMGVQASKLVLWDGDTLPPPLGAARRTSSNLSLRCFYFFLSLSLAARELAVRFRFRFSSRSPFRRRYFGPRDTSLRDRDGAQ